MTNLASGLQVYPRELERGEPVDVLLSPVQGPGEEGAEGAWHYPNPVFVVDINTDVPPRRFTGRMQHRGTQTGKPEEGVGVEGHELEVSWKTVSFVRPNGCTDVTAAQIETGDKSCFVIEERQLASGLIAATVEMRAVDVPGEDDMTLLTVDRVADEVVNITMGRLPGRLLVKAVGSPFI